MRTDRREPLTAPLFAAGLSPSLLPLRRHPRTCTPHLRRIRAALSLDELDVVGDGAGSLLPPAGVAGLRVFLPSPSPTCLRHGSNVGAPGFNGLLCRLSYRDVKCQSASTECPPSSTSGSRLQTVHQRLGPVRRPSCRNLRARRSVASSESWTRTSVRCDQSAAGMPATHLGMKAVETGLEPVCFGFRGRPGCRQPTPHCRALPESRTRLVLRTGKVLTHASMQGKCGSLPTCHVWIGSRNRYRRSQRAALRGRTGYLRITSAAHILMCLGGGTGESVRVAAHPVLALCVTLGSCLNGLRMRASFPPR